MLHWEDQIRQIDNRETIVPCYVDDAGNTVGEITTTLFSEKPDPRQITVRQATRRKPPQITNSFVIGQLSNGAESLKLGNLLGATFSGCVFPKSSGPISTGNYLSEEDAVRSVETWWNYWLKDIR